MVKTRASLTVITATVGLLLLVGTAQADIFVSNYGTGWIEKWDESGHVINPHFIYANGSSEGIACVKLTKNEIYIASNGSTIGVYDSTSGQVNRTLTTGASRIAALAFNAAGTVLYAADYGANKIWAVNPANGSNVYSPVTTTASHDIAVGPDGRVYAAHFQNATGVMVFNANLTGGASVFVPKTALPYAGGMVFDGSGNLWATSVYGPTSGIYQFAGPNSTSPNPATLLNSTADLNAFPLGLDISPINPTGPVIDACKGCVVIAELNTGTISQIDPSSCTLGHCTLQHPYFTPGGKPKYVHFTENCCDTGYFEICKMSCLTNPVTGNFTFTATNSGVSSGPITVPVNACSGPIQMPNGTITIQETLQLGTLVSGILAYDYDYLGNQINALLSSNRPFGTGNVNVISGDISTETVVGFENCKSGAGQLKICKVAGYGVPIGQPFTFTVKGPSSSTTYTVPAGPAPGGYCVVAGSYQVSTPLLVQESFSFPYAVASIAVAPADRGGTQTSNSAIVMIDAGTTEVTFTNVPLFQNWPPTSISGSKKSGLVVPFDPR